MEMESEGTTRQRHAALSNEDENGENTFQTQNDEEVLVDTGPQSSATIIKPTQCRGCTYYIEPLLFAFMFSQFPIIILTPPYIISRKFKDFSGQDINLANSNQSCDANLNSNVTDLTSAISGNYTQAQSAASLFELEASLAMSIPAMFIVMFIGPYSDKKGRKYALVIPLIGACIAMFNSMLNAYFDLPVELILVGLFIYGCAGSWPTLMMGCFSYISDVTTEDERQFRMILAELSMVIPSVLSAFGSGFGLDKLGFALVFMIIFIVNVFVLLYVIFVVPETVKGQPGSTFFAPVYVRKAITVFAVDSTAQRRRKLLTLLAAMFFCILGSAGMNINTLFVMNYPLCWSSELVGIQTAVNLAVGAIGSAITAKLFRFCLGDSWIAVISSTMFALQNVYLSFVKTTAMMFASVLFSITALLAIPTLRTMFSKLVNPNEIGAVFSGLAFVQMVCESIGNFIFAPIYSSTQAVGYPGLVFLPKAGCFLIAVIILVIHAIVTRERKRPEDQAPSGTVDVTG